jgi:hypothetical protein
MSIIRQMVYFFVLLVLLVTIYMPQGALALPPVNPPPPFVPQPDIPDGKK